MSTSKRVYEGLILAGIFTAIYVYGFAFNDFSETELVRLSYVWIPAIIFGTHGLIATEANEIVEAGRAASHHEAVPLRAHEEGRTLLSRFSSLLLVSYYLVLMIADGRRPVLLALMAAVLWTIALSVFFEGIFPAL
ncbi:MAG: hypothetical protein ACE5G0_22090 [Rhodothermales bacterium]